MKKKHEYAFFSKGKWRKILLIMKLKLFILLCCIQSVNATVFSQEQKLDISFDNELVIKVIDYLQNQTGVQFFYLDKNVAATDRVSVNMKQATLPEILDKVLKNKGYTYEMMEGVVIIKPIVLEEPEKKSLRLKGWVCDTKKQPMPGVTVKIVGVSLGTATDSKGWFALDLPMLKGALEFSFVGFKTKILEFNGMMAKDTLRVYLEEDVQALDEAVVVAYGTTTRREMTGAVSTVKGEELQGIPSPNIATLLQGRVAGMDITNISGAPGGGGTAITIRGYNSLDIELERRFLIRCGLLTGFR